ncbi:WD40-repeat-containing domain protein [Immersiella caudata]|uniref:WD40-repeat-containing domain protein n=1 Tax=Immersiella caudata TaxID=314043 RepID=A0AA39XDN7_9PEZI|nr:WD40-repeat-containing domain protein [Immersiella caudata]
MQQRRDEILAKKAKLAELKRQRELRASQATASRPSIGATSDLISPQPGRADRREIEKLIDDLVGESRPVSVSTGANSPARRGSRPNSVLSAGEISNATSEAGVPANGQVAVSKQLPQVLSTVPLATVYECPPSPVKEVFSYSKGVQTTEEWTSPRRPRALTDSDNEDAVTSTPSKRLSRREQDREDELRGRIRKEIEEELKDTRQLITDGTVNPSTTAGFTARQLTEEELKAVTVSEDFMDFIDRSTKVIEKALGQDYDILNDYTLQATTQDDEDEQGGNTGGKGRRRVKEVLQYYSERWSKKRMISDINFSPAAPELLVASYTKNPTAPHDPDGVVMVWNSELARDRPEYTFHAQSDILTAKFSPFHPNLVVGGSYSGQVLLWDNRAKAAPVQKTPLTGSGHTHPVYCVDIVGTQNANNIISCSTDGAVCGWGVDMFAQPQESMILTAPPPSKIEDLSPSCMAFPEADPTFFLVGTEEGTIYPCHRYDRAGAKAGVDSRVSYKGHTAPVMSVDFHPARGPVDLGDLVLSSSLDWSVKLWKVRAPAATSAVGSGLNTVLGESQVTPLLDFTREDVVYDAAWSPIKPGVFSLVDGGGWLELWDITVETEEPVARISPSARKDGRTLMSKSLNKVAWEPSHGKMLATGGIDGCVTLFEVGPDLGGKENLKNEEWANVKKLVSRYEGGGVNGSAAT